MALQNRVTPAGEIVATAERGLLMGNRGGALHDSGAKLGARRWVSRQWICCRLSFNGRKRQVMAPGRYTELFFLDEATALAAGHRPCFECRRSEADAFAVLWSKARGEAGRARAGVMDRVLHGERLSNDGSKRLHAMELSELPVGAMIVDPGSGVPMLALNAQMRPWTPAGYGAALARPARGLVDVLTPPSVVGVLRVGYRPLLHPSAGRTE